MSETLEESRGGSGRRAAARRRGDWRLAEASPGGSLSPTVHANDGARAAAKPAMCGQPVWDRQRQGINGHSRVFRSWTGLVVVSMRASIAFIPPIDLNCCSPERALPAGQVTSAILDGDLQHID